MVLLIFFIAFFHVYFSYFQIACFLIIINIHSHSHYHMLQKPETSADWLLLRTLETEIAAEIRPLQMKKHYCCRNNMQCFRNTRKLHLICCENKMFSKKSNLFLANKNVSATKKETFSQNCFLVFGVLNKIQCNLGIINNFSPEFLSVGRGETKCFRVL